MVILVKIVDYDVIDKNIKNIKKTNEIILVVKNNAYGFGIENILKLALNNNINYFAVNDINEAIELRKLNANIDILLFGYQIEYIDLIKKYNILPTVSSIDEINKYTNENVKVSLEIDCGMNRFGIKEFNEEILKNSLIVEIYTHLYKETNKNYKIIEYISNLAHKYNKRFHIGGSIAYKYTSYPIRIAHMIYENSESLIGKIVYIKEINKKETVGYDGIFKAKKKQVIGICNIGYYNGIRRNYNGRVVINNKYYKIVGKICMNHMFIIVDCDVKIGDFVTIFGENLPKSEFLSHNVISNYESFLLIR